MWPFRRKSIATKPTPVTYITIPGRLVRVTLCEHKGFSEKDLKKLVDAMCVISYVVNSDEFADIVNNHGTYTFTDDFSWYVYEKIMKGVEQVDGYREADAEIDLSLQYYNSRWSRVIGYTYPKQLHVWLNWKYHLSFSAPETAGNIFHEWLHKIGYDHASASDHTSVPYALGFLMEELGEKHLVEAMKLREKVEVITRGAV